MDNAYFGSKKAFLTEEQLSHFYTYPEDNSFLNCLRNQYLIIADSAGGLIPEAYLWNGEFFRRVPHLTFSSYFFGDISPKNGDPFQKAYMDSLSRNDLTIATGAGGSGKSLLALAYAFSQLEKKKISRIVVITNPYVAKGATKLGYRPGTTREKLLETSIGNTLISKLGGRIAVDQLIDQEKLILLPIGDVRGYEVPADSFLYCTEMQNASRYLMRLLLQRVPDGVKVCLEGDVEDQVDSEEFEGEESGLSRAIKVFAGEDYFGHIRLETVWRGKIADKARNI